MQKVDGDSGYELVDSHTDARLLQVVYVHITTGCVL